EVSNYGELIAGEIAKRLIAKKSLSQDLLLPFVQTAENACLLHDIGNPPFGHMGEYAISKWFEANRAELAARWGKDSEMTETEANEQLQPFQSFDGNPQGFRIITRLQWFRDEYGMNLTCGLLGAYTKYLADSPNSDSPFNKKIGFFPSE